MPQVRLVCWDQQQAREHARVLKKAGFTVDASPLATSRLIGQFRDKPPAVILIDLDRLPSHGRAVAIMLRGAKSTGHIPVVFAGGLEDKVQRAREQLPRAIFTDWPGVIRALRKALKSPPVPVLQKSYMQQYAGSSLVKKLGFKPGMRAA